MFFAVVYNHKFVAILFTYSAKLTLYGFTNILTMIVTMCTDGY